MGDLFIQFIKLIYIQTLFYEQRIKFQPIYCSYFQNTIQTPKVSIKLNQKNPPSGLSTPSANIRQTEHGN